MLKKFFAIIEETYREALARKTIIGFFIFSTVVIVITMFFFLNPTVRDSMSKLESMSKSSRPNVAADIIMVKAIDIFWTIILVALYLVTICLGVFSTTGFITSQMEKGTIDLLISKPVPRWLYILGRYTATLSIIFLQVVWFILGIWIVVGATMGLWQPYFLSCIIFIMLGFASIYSIVVLISILSGSSALSMITGVGIFFVSLIVAGGRGIEGAVDTTSKSVLSYVGDVLYYILPQTGDMSGNMKSLILGNSIEWTPIFLIIGLTVVYLSAAIFAFNKKEF
jgi:ABC-type transport system involved in multi-copper enzyme maturation permease subunit